MHSATGLTQEAVGSSGRWRCRNEVHLQERQGSQDALRIPRATAAVGGAKEQRSCPGVPPTLKTALGRDWKSQTTQTLQLTSGGGDDT